MKTLTFICNILFLSVFLNAQEFNYKDDFETVLKRTKDSSDVLFHEKLMLKYQTNDSSLTDFQMLALLINFTKNDHYKPYQIAASESKIAMLNQKKQYREAILTCDSLLKNHPFNQAILFEKALAHFELNQADSANFYRIKFNRIMDAMSFSGTGTSSDNAIFSLGSRDSHNYIINRLSQQVNQVGSGVDEDGNFLDIIETVDENEGTHLLHFQIQHAVNKLLESTEPIEK